MKRILTMFFTSIIIFVSFISIFCNGINENSESFENLVKLGIIKNCSSISESKNFVTRAEFTEIIINCLNLCDAIKLNPSTPKFSDISKEHQSAGIINLAYENKLISGYDDGAFKPDNFITYAESISLIIKALDYDTSKMIWPEDYFFKADELGITNNIIKSDDYSNYMSYENMISLVNSFINTPLVNPNGCLSDNIVFLNKESAHFLFFCSVKDKDTLEELSNYLESNYKRITDNLKHSPKEKVVVKVYPDLKTFHNAVGSPDAPDWAIGRAMNGKIYMVSPSNPGPSHTYNSVVNSISHEFTHIVLRVINKGSLPIWLNEGIASYEGKNIDGYKLAIKDEVNQGKIPSLEQLNNRQDFEQLKGYCYSITIIEYIINDFGYDKLIEFVKNPTDFKSVFNINQNEFYSQWVQYLNNNYK